MLYQDALIQRIFHPGILTDSILDREGSPAAAVTPEASVFQLWGCGPHVGLYGIQMGSSEMSCDWFKKYYDNNIEKKKYHVLSELDKISRGSPEICDVEMGSRLL